MNTKKTYPMATFDMLRALLDCYTDEEIRNHFEQACEMRSRAAYNDALRAAGTPEEAMFGRVVNHYTTRAKFWRKAKVTR